MDKIDVATFMTAVLNRCCPAYLPSDKNPLKHHDLAWHTFRKNNFPKVCPNRRFVQSASI